MSPCCNQDVESSSVCGYGSVLTFLFGGAGALLLFSVAPLQEAMSGDMAKEQQIIATALPEVCTVSLRSLVPRCREVQMCAESERRCSGAIDCVDVCLTYKAGLACHCEVTVMTKGNGTFAAEFDVGVSPVVSKNREQWCRTSIESDKWLAFATIVTLAPTSQERWECFLRHSKSKDLVQELWSAAIDGTPPRCLSKPTPDVPTDCVVVEDGRLMLGSKDEWVALFAEVNERSYAHRKRMRIVGWSLVGTAAAIWLVSFGLCCAARESKKSKDRGSRVFSRTSEASYEPAGEEEEADEPQYPHGLLPPPGGGFYPHNYYYPQGLYPYPQGPSQRRMLNQHGTDGENEHFH